MKKITNLMINMYNLKNIDFMGYKVSKDNPYTFHHLKKRCHGGKEVIENGAILTKLSHQYLHIVESRDLVLYEYINNVLKQINEQGFEPLKRQLLAIDYILKIFEEEHINDLSCKNKKLIKGEYLNR
jgi:hypothetical protein